GWARVGERHGITKVGKENAVSRTMAGLAAFSGFEPLQGEAAGKDEYAAMYISPVAGEPVLFKDQRRALQHPDGGHDKLGVTIKMADGFSVQVDPHAPDLNRELRRNTLVQEARARTDMEETLPNALGVATSAGE